VRQELDQKLNRRFPFYKGFWGKGVAFEHGDGWYDLIYELSVRIEKLIETNVLSKDIAVYQVKEKYGTLRFYTSFYTKELDELIEDAEERSKTTCEMCGKTGTTREVNGWLSTLCIDHYQENLNSQMEY